MKSTEVNTNTGTAVLPYIIAVDFDGTLVMDMFPKIGPVKSETLRQLRRAKEQGCAIVLWTCRTGKHLEEAVELMDSLGIVFDAINDNIDEVKALGWEARKVYAHEYWDDKAVAFFTNQTTSDVVADEGWVRKIRK